VLIDDDAVLSMLGLQSGCGCVLLQNKDRVNLELIKPAVDWRKTGVADASASAAIARA